MGLEDKPIIMAVVGKSGSGKTELVKYLEKKYHVSQIQSYTDRAKRTPDETGHVFVSKEVYDTFDKEDMIAHTEFGGKRYCCLKQDVKDKNTYVIDEYGLDYLIDNFGTEFDIKTVFVERPLNLREMAVSRDRLARDHGKFSYAHTFYDYVVFNETLNIQDLRDAGDYLYLDVFASNKPLHTLPQVVKRGEWK